MKICGTCRYNKLNMHSSPCSKCNMIWHSATSCQWVSMEQCGPGTPVEVKPPIGLIPRFIVYEERLKDILDAIIRYHRSGIKEIPVEWIYEYNDIIRYLNEKDGNKTSSNVKKPDVTTWDSAPARVPDPWCMCKECTELRGKRIDKELEKNK